VRNKAGHLLTTADQPAPFPFAIEGALVTAAGALDLFQPNPPLTDGRHPR